MIEYCPIILLKYQCHLLSVEFQSIFQSRDPAYGSSFVFTDVFALFLDLVFTTFFKNLPIISSSVV